MGKGSCCCWPSVVAAAAVVVAVGLPSRQPGRARGGCIRLAVFTLLSLYFGGQSTLICSSVTQG